MPSGGKRAGAGRPPLDHEQPTTSEHLTMTERDARLLADIGDGNKSAGLRRIMADWRINRDTVYHRLTSMHRYSTATKAILGH